MYEFFIFALPVVLFSIFGWVLWDAARQDRVRAASPATARAREERAKLNAELDAWCPEMVKVLRGRKPNRCEHLNTDTLYEGAVMSSKISGEYRLQRIREFINRNNLPGSGGRVLRVNGDNGHVSKRYENYRWYADSSRSSNRDLDWHDREQAQSWGMDADTYRSNWLEAE